MIKQSPMLAHHFFSGAGTLFTFYVLYTALYSSLSYEEATNPAVNAYTPQMVADQTYSSSDTPIAIAPSGTSSISSTITVPVSGAGVITDLNLVGLNLTHTYIDDLTLTLRSPAGTEVTLLSGHCSYHDDLLLDFDDAGTSFFNLPCPATDGMAYQAAGFLSSFDGEDPQGNWVLTVEDGADLDGGTLNAWSLRIITDTHIDGPCVLPGCTVTHNTVGSCINYTLSVGDTLCVLEDYNCQITFNGGAIYVAPGVNFSPINANNFTGTLINCGTSTFGSVTFEAGTIIRNYGEMSCTGSLGINGLSSFTNGGNATFNIATNFNLQQGSSFTNEGVVNASGEFKISDGTFINEAILNTTGNFVTETAGSNVTNNGRVISQSDININPNSNVVNNCTFNARNTIVVDTDLQNNGLLYAKNGTGRVEVNSTATFSNNGDLVANDLIISGDVLGSGFLWLSGSTTLNGSASFGTDVKGLNIYDSSTPVGGQFFDTQDGTLDPSVTNSAPVGTDTIPAESELMLTCSPTLQRNNTEICDNGIDDDLDGLTDCADPDCTYEVSLSSSNESCLGAADGSVAAGTGKGGQAPFTYIWSTGATTASITSLTADTYTVTLTDANGCTAVDSTTLTANPLPTAEAGTDQSICSGDNANLTASGGSTYLWSTTETTANITVSPLSTTRYYVTVTDAGGCTAIDSVNITVSNLPTAEAGTDQSICSGDNANLTASGGSTYLWSTTETTANITVSPLSTTRYYVTVTDAGGCTAI
ncbi:MAG: proprotein convertase P-domain-containing protein, partial [Bacteroidota bacterium]